jgi:hypothetical protein
MDKQIYLAISARILQEVPEFKWIDYDWGQLSSSERPAVAFPCVLIDIAYSDCRNLSEGAGATEQLVTASISLKLAFEPFGDTRAGIAPDLQNAGLKPLNTIDALHTALQGWNGGGTFSGLSRKRGNSVPPRNSLKVYNLTYETRFVNTPD